MIDNVIGFHFYLEISYKYFNLELCNPDFDVKFEISMTIYLHIHTRVVHGMRKSFIM
jgi:hypothetical protein